MTATSRKPRPRSLHASLTSLLAALAFTGLAVLAMNVASASASATASATASAHVATLASPATPPPPPAQDPFYRYTGATPLAQIAPGTVLNTRTTSFHLAGIPLPRIALVQLLYRSNTALGAPTTNVTSVLLPPTPSARPQLVAYGSFYDSLNRDDEPSYTFAGAPLDEGRELPSVEAAVIAPLLLAGDTVDVADTEGQAADFAAGPEYGMLTLDSIRAAIASPDTHLTGATPVALMGYSGGAIATGWAAQLAPSYAPDVEDRLVGATMGGVLIEPAHNLNYVSGSLLWAGVAPMALIGSSRAYHVSLARFLSPYGAQVVAGMQQDSITQANDDYPRLTFAQLIKPEYIDPESIPPFVRTANQLIMGHDALPQVPLLIAQGAGGALIGTNGHQPGIGPGDGVMITGDVRSYAREACAAGDPVQYSQYDLLPHSAVIVPWELASLPWLAARFAGQAPPSDCADIAPGNSLAPVTYQPPAG